MLTSKQLDLLRFLELTVREKGIAPSFDEMAASLGLASKSGIHRLITALEERGFIRRLPNRARAIEILRMPAPPQGRQALLAGPGDVIQMTPRTVPVSIMGRIAAGTPISAIQERGRSVEMPADMLSVGEHYALEVHGDSMIEAGIFNGDLAVVRRQDSAQPGDIVVALIDGEEATLKRFKRRGASIALEAANPAYATRVLQASRVRIQGKLASIIRRY